MPTLLSLPQELLNSILSLLSNSDRLRVLLTCNEARRKAEAALYEDIDLPWAYPSTERTDAPIHALVLTLHHHPHLARLVQHLTLQGDVQPSDDRPPPQPTQLQSDQAVALINNGPPRLRSLYISQSTSETRSPVEGLEVWWALLITHLPELKTLVVKAGSYESVGIGRFVQETVLSGHRPYLEKPAHSSYDPLEEKNQACTSPFSESALRKIAWHAKYRWLDSGKWCPGILSLLYLPYLQDLSYVSNSAVAFDWPEEHRPNAELLTSLRLDNIREGNLSTILSVTPNLRCLHWHWVAEGCRRGSRVDVLDRDQVVQDLLLVQHTLVELFITAESDVDRMCSLEDAHPVEIRGSLAGIREMARLETLGAPVALFFGLTPSDSYEDDLKTPMPPKLEHLSVNDCLADQTEMFWQNEYTFAADLIPALEAWLRVVKLHSPRLSTFDYIDVDPHNATEDHKDLLESACGRIGITGRFVTPDPTGARAYGAQPRPI